MTCILIRLPSDRFGFEYYSHEWREGIGIKADEEWPVMLFQTREGAYEIAKLLEEPGYKIVAPTWETWCKVFDVEKRELNPVIAEVE